MALDICRLCADFNSINTHRRIRYNTFNIVWYTTEKNNRRASAEFEFIYKRDPIPNLRPRAVQLALWILTHFPREISMKFQIRIFQTNFSDWWLGYLLWNCPQMNATGPYWWCVNIGSVNDLVPSGNKPSPEPMLTQIYVAIWRHYTTVSDGGNLLYHKGITVFNDLFDITWWRHQMETFSALLAICAGNSPVPGEFPAQKASDVDLWRFLWSASE